MEAGESLWQMCRKSEGVDPPSGGITIYGGLNDGLQTLGRIRKKEKDR
jgi:hypothetical protein